MMHRFGMKKRGRPVNKARKREVLAFRRRYPFATLEEIGKQFNMSKQAVFHYTGSPPRSIERGPVEAALVAPPPNTSRTTLRAQLSAAPLKRVAETSVRRKATPPSALN